MKRVMAWHRPLMVTAAIMMVCAVVCIVGLVVDDREVFGANVWMKPLKFSLSIAIYAVTWAWLIYHLPRFKRLAHIAGTIAAITLLVEQAIIVGASAAGTASHFNVSTPFHTAMWAVMAASIAVLYFATLITTFAAFFITLGSPSITLALRTGAVLALIGMGLAFLMTAPSTQQISDFNGVVGAHAVGVDDGGPGLPVLGWSTVAGDLRIPHFVGMHALQVVPLFAIALAFIGKHWSRLADDRTRYRLVWVATISFALVLALVTAQALAGQSIVRPDGIFLIGGWAITIATVVAFASVLLTAPRGSATVEDEKELVNA